MKIIRASSLLVSLVVLAACATHPSSPPPAAVAAPPVATRAAMASETTNVSLTETPHSIVDTHAEARTYALSRGYKSAHKDGKQLWCKSEAQLGTHFETMSCVPEDYILEQKRRAQDLQQEMSKRRNCSGPSCFAN